MVCGADPAAVGHHAITEDRTQAASSQTAVIKLQARYIVSQVPPLDGKHHFFVTWDGEGDIDGIVLDRYWVLSDQLSVDVEGEAIVAENSASNGLHIITLSKTKRE